MSDLFSIANGIFQNQKCKVHTNSPFLFYCFDDKTFLCEACFKYHKKHQVEVKFDLKEKNELFLMAYNGEKGIAEKNTEYNKALIQIKEETDKELKRNSEYNKEKETFSPPSAKITSIFELTYPEYENLEKFINEENMQNNFLEKISNIIKGLNKGPSLMPKNLRWISKEVKIIDHSKFYSGYPPEIMLDKQNGDYSLTEGNRNHMIKFEFDTEFYIKQIKLSFAAYECCLKNFQVSIEKKGNWEIIGKFQCKSYFKDSAPQIFDLQIFTKKIMFDLIDNHGSGGGNYILIKKLEFYGAEAI